MTKPMFNGKVAGFNKNGLVLVQLSDGSTVPAKQTGNGVLSIGQPVVHQPGLSAGLAGVCYDPSAVAGESKLWRPQTYGGRPEEEDEPQPPSGSPPAPLPPPGPPVIGSGNSFSVTSLSGAYIPLDPPGWVAGGGIFWYDIYSPPNTFYPAQPISPNLPGWRKKLGGTFVSFSWFVGWDDPRHPGFPLLDMMTYILKYQQGGTEYTVYGTVRSDEQAGSLSRGDGRFFGIQVVYWP